MTPSAEQLLIFDWFKTGSGNLVIKARAGTGKTTTIKLAFDFAPETNMAYFVFNKKNELEAKEKIKNPLVRVQTLHSLGYSFIRNVWPSARADGDIEFDRCDAVFNFRNYPLDRAMLVKLVGFAKNQFITPTDADLTDICDERDIEFSQHVNGIKLCQQVLELSKQQDSRNRISFNDMVWLPCALGLVRPMYDLVACDECQDMSVPQLMMVKHSSRGRVVVIGDDRQCIYGFRGCAQDGLAMMKESLNASELTLTTTYRCPKSVVNLAREIVPDYRAANSAPEGVAMSVKDALTALPGDAILSRLNAPLMPLALNLLRNGIPARIEGRDFASQLISMVKNQKAKSVPHFFEKIGNWLNKQIARFEKSKNADKKIEQSRDIHDTLTAIAEGCKSVAEIESRIVSMFQDTNSNSKPAVVLSSVHRAKGLEFRRVFLLTETFRRGKGIEEDNLWYVACTRAMESLFLVTK